MTKYKYYFTLFFMLLGLAQAPLSIALQNNQNQTTIDLNEIYKKYRNYQFSFLLPINVYDDKINLNIKIPKKFTLINNQKKEHLQIIQFAGSQDQANVIITITFQVGGKFVAKNLLDNMTAYMQKKASSEDAKDKFSILKSADNLHAKYADGFRLILSENDNKKYLIYVYSASGPYDSVLLQYSARIQPEDNLKLLIAQAEQFFEEYVHVVRSEK